MNAEIWLKALQVFAIGFSGVFLGLIVLDVLINLFGMFARALAGNAGGDQAGSQKE